MASYCNTCGINEDRYDKQEELIRDLQQQLDKERRSAELFAIRVLRQERYDYSPCQAHPLELVEKYLEDRLATITKTRAPMVPSCNPGVVCTHEGACHLECGGDHYYDADGVCLRCRRCKHDTPLALGYTCLRCLQERSSR